MQVIEPTPRLPKDQAANLLKLYQDFKDPQKFIEESLKVQNRQGKLVPFILKNAQRRLIDRVEAKRAAGMPIRFIIDKTRRVGMSAVIAALIFQRSPFWEGQSALILAHEKPAARNLFSYYDRFRMNFKGHKGIVPPRLLSRNASEDKGALVWANRSTISIATAANVDFSRSFDFRFLHLSEYAYYPKIRGLMMALIATVADDSDTMIFKESTAQGYNDFYQDCKDAMAGKGDYEFFFAGCFEDEQNWRDLERDQVDPVKFEASMDDDEWALTEKYDLVLEQVYWRRKVLEEYKGDLKRFDQEFPHSWQVSFQSSGRQRFDPKLFMWMPTQVPKEVGGLETIEVNREKVLQFTPNRYGEFTMWKRPEPGGEYVGGADVAKGVDINDGVGTPDPDWCAAAIGDRHLGEQVAELHIRLEPTPYAKYLYDVGKFYNWVYWVVEVEFSGGNGMAVLTEMIRLGYPLDHLYFAEVLDEATSRRKKQVGFVIRPNTKPSLIANHERMLIERAVILHSEAAIDEHQTFVKKANGKVEHQDQCHDDLVFSSMYLSWAMVKAPVFQTVQQAISAMPKKWGRGGESDAERAARINMLRRKNSVVRGRKG